MLAVEELEISKFLNKTFSFREAEGLQTKLLVLLIIGNFIPASISLFKINMEVMEQFVK